MSERQQQPPAPPRIPFRWMPGCLLRVAVALAALFVIFIVLGLVLDTEPAPRPDTRVNAGPADAFEAGDVNYLEFEHIFVVRLDDGAFLAIYDKSPKQQELGSDCRLSYDSRQQLGSLEQLPGFRGAFVEECEGRRAIWRADGRHAFGADNRDLDRFETEVNGAGELIIETARRTCTRSRGVPNIPPFDVTTCRGND